MKSTETVSGDISLHKEKNRIPALDGVRGFAVLSVFILHYGGGAQSSNVVVRTIGEVIKLGWSGVTLFFVLSGYLITGILWSSFGKEHWWRAFYIRRCLRIFPLYYLMLLIVLVTGLLRYQIRDLGSPLAVYALYLQGFPTNVSGAALHPFTLGHFWSLAVEEHFYLVWPFLLVRMPNPRAARYLCVGVMAISLAFRVWVVYSGASGFYSFTPARMGELALGAWLALAHYENPNWFERIRRLALPIALVSFCAVGALAKLTDDFSALKAPMYLFGVPLFSFAHGALILLVLRNGRICRWFSAAPLRHVGVISYGIYVYHIFLIEFFKEAVFRAFPNLPRNTQLALIFVVATLLTLTVAELSYHYVEKPLLSLKRKFTPGSRIKAADATVNSAAT